MAASLPSIAISQARGLKGELRVPGDKSITHRAMILASLADGRSEVTGFLRGDDCLRTASALSSMGVEIHGLEGETLSIYGKGFHGLKEPQGILDCGNSGTTIRLLSGLLAGQPFFSVLTGDGSLRKRPMRRVVEPLTRMGATILGRDGGNFPPLAIQGGPLRGITYESPVASAQVKSALLLAGLFASGETSVIEPAPSRDHMERLLQAFGASIVKDGTQVTLRAPGSLIPQQLQIPGDFSSAAFFLVAALLIPDSELIVRDVGVNPTRTGLLEALQAAGAEIVVENPRLVSGEPVADLRARTSSLKGVEVSGALIPRMIDELPAFAVAACLADGVSVIRDASELRVKEVDRLSALTSELRKLGAQVEERPDGLLIEGGHPLRGAVCQSMGDHRMAMTLALAGLVAEGTTIIRDPFCVDISFPGFFDTLAALAPGCLAGRATR